MLLVYLVSAWFLGIWLASRFTAVPVPAWLVIGVLSLMGALLLRRQQTAVLLLACLGLLAFGGARYTAVQPTITPAHIAYYNGETAVTLTGIVAGEPDVRDRSINLRVAVTEIELGGGTAVPVTGLIQARVFRFPPIPYGAQVRLSGSLETPPSDGDFNYKDYLARHGVHSLMNLPRATVLAERQGHPLYHAIYALKARAQATIVQLLPNPQAALLTGILLGNDNGLPPDLAADFRAIGMTHIIAISGFNIAILIAILVSISEPFLGRRGAAVFAVTGIVLYTILVGADASVVRAAIMGIIYLFTQRWLGRPNFAFASLFAAGFLMTLVNPFTLWDVGFQLSFMATLSLMLYADPFSKWTERQVQRLMSRQQARRVMGILSDAVVITLAAQVLTLPLMVGYFQQLSLISLPANFLILPAQPAVMTWGGLATLVGLVSPTLAQPIAWVAWLPLTYTITLVRLFAAVPYAAVPVNVSWGWVLAFYGLLAVVTYLARLEPERRQRLLADLRPNWGMRAAFGSTAVLALLVFSWAASQPDGKLHVAFLDVGQGDAIFIQTPSGRQILVDGGNDPSVLNDRLGRQMPFWDRHIDIMVATHPDADHVSGLVELYGRYQIGQLITDGEGMGASSVYDALLQAATAQQTPLHRAMAGEVIEISDGVRLEMVHPGAELDEENRNDNSVSFRLVYGDFSVMLTGDTEEKGEAQMLQKGYPLQSLVFKAGHHGSQTSSTTPFLQAVQPHILIISAGADNRFGHPHPEVLQRAAEMGTAVLRTDELGTIEVITDGQLMWWQAWGGNR